MMGTLGIGKSKFFERKFHNYIVFRNGVFYSLFSFSFIGLVLAKRVNFFLMYWEGNKGWCINNFYM